MKLPFSYNSTQAINSQSSERLNRHKPQNATLARPLNATDLNAVDRSQVMSQLMNIADEIVNKSFERSGSKSNQRKVIKAIDKIASYLSTNTANRDNQTSVGSLNPPR